LIYNKQSCYFLKKKNTLFDRIIVKEYCMQKITLSLALLISSISCASYAVIIEVSNQSPRAITATLYEAVEEKSSLGEPEIEQTTQSIKPDQIGIINTSLNAGKYELDAYDTGKDILKTTRGRELDILVDDNSNHFKVVVKHDSIEWSRQASAHNKPKPTSRHPHHRYAQ
jgi:hypothetical protein